MKKYKKFTIETRLKIKGTLLEYILKNLQKQAIIFRIVWKLIQTTELSQSKLNTYLQQKYNIDKRTANTHIQTAIGRLNALKELKKLELANLTNKIASLEIEIKEIKEKLDKLKKKVVSNKATDKELERYRRTKRSLWHKKQKLNRLKQKLPKAERMADASYYPVCWGSKSLFKKQFNLKHTKFKSHEGWLNYFRRKRDSQINYIGSSDERCGNQCFQLTYDKESKSFSAQIRKDIGLMNDENDKYIHLEGIRFGLYHKKLADYLENPKITIAARILRRDRKWYLQIIFDYIPDDDSSVIDEKLGTMGLDFNVGFVEISETDYFGNMISQNHYPLKHHGTGNKAKSEMRNAAADIVKTAKAKSKAIVIEDLDFKKKKSSVRKSAADKKYNKIIHSFDYSRYEDCFENACYRNGVKLIKVNPAKTSKIGDEKYASRMKLNVHQSASYVIARKGQGYKDRLAKKPKSRKRKTKRVSR